MDRLGRDIQLYQEGVQILEGGCGFAGLVVRQLLDLCLLVLREGDSDDDCVERVST